MASKAVAVADTQGAALPALRNTPALEIGAEDIALPRMYIGQFMSDAVKDKNIDVYAGDIYVATGKDDPDPVKLWSYDDKGKAAGPTVYVLSLRRGKSISEGGELVLFDYDDPSAPADAWVTYNYMCYVPAYDEDVPVKWLLTRTGKPAAQAMNTVLKKRQASGPSWATAFEFTSDQRENKKGEFWVPRIRPIGDADVDQKQVERAGELAIQMSGHEAEFNSTGAAPAI